MNRKVPGLLLGALLVFLGRPCQALDLSAYTGASTQPAEGSCACAAAWADPQAVDALLQQLAAARNQNSGLRDQLLRQKHHRPVVIVNPLGAVDSTVWQLLCAALAVFGGTLLAHNVTAKKKAADKYSKLQQILQQREEQWQSCFNTVRVRLQQHIQKEVGLKAGLEQMTRLLQERAAALHPTGTVMPEQQPVMHVSKCFMPLSRPPTCWHGNRLQLNSK